MSKTTPLEQALRAAWYDGYYSAVAQANENPEIPAEYYFEKYMVRIIESLEKGEGSE